MNTKNKNIFLVIGGIIIIVLGYFVFNYFYPSVSAENKKSSENIFDEDDNKLQPPADYENSANISKEQRLAKLQELSRYKNLSDFKGKEIYDLIQILEQLRLDIDFFNSASFKSLIDYTREVTVSNEEKGNTNPFVPVR